MPRIERKTKVEGDSGQVKVFEAESGWRRQASLCSRGSRGDHPCSRIIHFGRNDPGRIFECVR